jgi:hypothetical protein
MTSQEAQRALDARQQELTALEQERDGLGLELGELNNQRNAAVRALARGGGSPERKAIMALEQQMTPLAQRLEGLGILVTEAVEAVTQAKATLEEAKAVEAAATANAFEARERSEGLAVVEGLPGLLERIAEAYAQICLLVGEFAVAQVQVDDLSRRVGGVDPAQIEQLRMNFIPEVTARLEAWGLRQLMVPGFYGALPVWGIVQDDPDFVAAHGGVQVDPAALYLWQQAQARERFGRELNEQGGAA